MQRISPADELADIRAELARLRLREAILRAELLNRRDEDVAGRWYRAEVVETRARVLDPALLPPEIRDDPHFWRDRISQTVRCVPIRFVPPQRSGWPIGRATALQEREQPTARHQ